MHLKLDELIKNHDFSKFRYMEFVRKESLSAGIYQLPKGSEDLQKPHAEDEIYYVLSGKGKFQVDGSSFDVGKGSIIFVAALKPHKFFDIEEELTILVFFAPAES